MQRSHQDLPSFYDDLEGSFDRAWDLLARGVKDRRSAFHTPVLVTRDNENIPDFRTVVLRGAFKECATLRFHTDRRSGKIGQLTSMPECGVHGYDRVNKVQLRMKGVASLHFDDDIASSAWACTQPGSRTGYSQMTAPGRTIDAPATIDYQSEDCQQNFGVIQVMINRLEWLYLSHTGHRRALWTRDGGKWTGNWLAP